MNQSPAGPRVREVIFAAIFVLAAGLRLSGLGRLPLTDAEASEALAAAAGTQAQSEFWPVESPPAASAVYRSLTWLLFQATAGDGASARLLPALAGAFIVVLPWFLRRRLGTAPALTISFLLAVSPTLVATSRTAGGASLAVVAVAGGAAALWLALERAVTPSQAALVVGTCLAVGLGAGPMFFHGLILLVAAAAVSSVTSVTGWPRENLETLRSVAGRALLGGAVGAVALAVAGGLHPAGTVSLAEGFRQWLAGWVGPRQMHPLTPAVLLIVYEPLLLVFGVAGAVHAARLRERTTLLVSWWALLALVLATVYPGRTGEAMAWVVVPLAVLAGRAVWAGVERWRRREAGWIGSGFAGFLVFLWAYAGLQLSAYASGIGPGATPQIPEARLAVAVGALLVSVLASILIGFGWSWQTIRSGVGQAALVILLMTTVSSLWQLNFGESRRGAKELWSASVPGDGLTRLIATVESLSRSAHGLTGSLPMSILADEVPPSLAWALRSVPRFTPMGSGGAEAPPLALWREREAPPGLPAEYLGQTIPLAETQTFLGPLPPDLLGWWFRRRTPVAPTNWVLFVRSDIATLGEVPSQPR